MKKTAAETREEKRFWFYFEPADFKGVQDYLNEKAAQGWELIAVDGILTARFVWTERSDLTYCVEVAPLWDAPENNRDYIQLCEDAGWELVDKSRNGVQGRNGMWIFKSLPGRNPPPVQTDKQAEAKRFQKYVLLIPLLLLLTRLPAYCLGSESSLWREARYLWCVDWIKMNLFLSFLLIGVYAVMTAANGVWYRWSIQKYGEMTAPPRAVMYGRGIFLLFCWGIVGPLWLAGALLGMISSEIRWIGYLMFGVIFLMLLVQATVGINFWKPTARQRKLSFCLAGLCLVSLLVFIFLGEKGPWMIYSSGGLNMLAPSPAGWRETVSGEPILQAEDLGIEYRSLSASYEHSLVPVGSMWKNHETVSLESSETAAVKSQYFSCFTNGAAALLTDCLRRGIEDGVANDYPYSPIFLTKQTLDGFDEVWYGSGDNGWDQLSYSLLVRQGKTVALVTATVDLLEPEHLNSVKAALGF